MHFKHIDYMEEEISGRKFIKPNVRPGDTVRFGAWKRTVTQKAIDCDCGKGMFCPHVIEERA